MALIRGSTGKRPCPICFVNPDDLTKITNTWTLRTADHTQSLIQQARSIQRPIEREKLLSNNGIRDVDVSDPGSHMCLCDTLDSECILAHFPLGSTSRALIRQAPFKQ
jgi:hypothetical protein